MGNFQAALYEGMSFGMELGAIVLRVGGRTEGAMPFFFRSCIILSHKPDKSSNHAPMNRNHSVSTERSFYKNIKIKISVT